MSGVSRMLLSSLVYFRLCADLTNALRSRVVSNWRKACVIGFAGQNVSVVSYFISSSRTSCLKNFIVPSSRDSVLKPVATARLDIWSSWPWSPFF